MPPLKNPRHEQFAQLVATGKSTSGAYVHVYQTEKGTKSAGQSGHRLLKNAEVAARIAEIRSALEQSALGRVILDRDFVIDGLKENFRRAMQAEPVLDGKGKETGAFVYAGGVANKALELMGKEIGMFVDKSESSVSHTSLRDIPLKEIDRMIAEGEALRAQRERTAAAMKKPTQTNETEKPS
jgi:phage terminase small subunit